MEDRRDDELMITLALLAAINVLNAPL